MKLQFTLRQLFVCTAYFSVAFAIAVPILPYWENASAVDGTLSGIVGIFGPFVVSGAVGAAVGHILGSTIKGAVFGLLMAPLWLIFLAIRHVPISN